MSHFADTDLYQCFFLRSLSAKGLPYLLAPEVRIPENRWMYVVRGVAFGKMGVYLVGLIKVRDDRSAELE